MEEKKHVIQQIALDKNENYVHVSEVPNGDACGCVCPFCGAPLTAKHGKGKKASHFAHKAKEGCHYSEEYVIQTNIHWRAEKLFLQKKEILLPKLIKQYGNWMSSLPSMKLDTKSVELEKKISDFIPDIIVECGNMTVLVEIYVTHQVDDEKKAKIQKEGKYYVIEIDLSDKAYETVSDEELWNLINDETRIEWIYVPFFLDFYRNLGCFLAFDSTSRHVANCPQMFPTIDYCKRCNAYMGITDDSYVRCIRNNPEAIRLAKQLGFVLVDKTYDYPSFIEFNFRSVHSIVNRGALIDRIEEQQERRQYQSRNNKMPKFHNRKRWHRH